MDWKSRVWVASLVCVMSGAALAESNADTDVTYHRDIAPIMQKHCVACHREGAVGPFALDSFEALVDYAPMIQDVIRRRVMPPWFAAPEKDGHASPWANERVLTDYEKNTLAVWAKSGRTEGDPADAPEPMEYPDGWEIGEPDAEFSFAQAIPIPAEGVIPYLYIPVETNLEEDKWIAAIEFQPGVADVVHHILVFVMTPEMTEEDLKDAGAINYWAVYVPGNKLQIYPKDHARLLPAGSKLIFQMHYTTNGTAVEDKTRIGFRFADAPPKFEVRTTSIVKSRFEIPPEESHFQISKKETIDTDLRVLGYLPHHHVRGVAARYELLSDDGEAEMLLDVPHYDFNWQLFYRYRTPRIIPAGSTIRYTAWYDNSANNPANPDPTQTVSWGPQTFDEMHLGYVEYTVPRVDQAPVASKDVSLGTSDSTVNRE